jgi:type IV pilus assembly protein PilA
MSEGFFIWLALAGMLCTAIAVFNSRSSECWRLIGAIISLAILTNTATYHTLGGNDDIIALIILIILLIFIFKHISQFSWREWLIFIVILGWATPLIIDGYYNMIEQQHDIQGFVIRLIFIVILSLSLFKIIICLRWYQSLMLGVTLGLIASIIIPAFDDREIRPRITEGLALAGSAKNAVRENAEQGQAFNSAWIEPNATKYVSTKPVPTELDRQTNVYSGIAINPTNGVITITYTDKIDQGSPTILLIPMVNGKSPTLGKPIGKYATNWECHSKTAPKDDISQLLGTVKPRYVPTNCRD